MTTATDLLLSVAGSGEVVTLVYNAGSRPGQARQLVPVSISDDALVAVELGSSIKKTFKVDRIGSVELANGRSAINPLAIPPTASALPQMPAMSTLAEYVACFRSELSVAGWHLCEEENLFGIATRFKNGKPKRTPCVLIRFFDRSTDTDFDLEAGEFRTVSRELTGRERPWRVDSWRFKDGKTLRELQQAFALFMEEARASDPSTAKTLWAGN